MNLNQAINEVEQLILKKLPESIRDKPELKVELIHWESPDPAIGFRVAEISVSWTLRINGQPFPAGFSFMQMDSRCWPAIYCAERAVLERLVCVPGDEFQDDRLFWDKSLLDQVFYNSPSAGTL